MENLKKIGWILTEAGLKSVESTGSSKNLNKILLDRDLREIGAGIIDLSKGKFENIDHDLAVLQIMKIRNISAPKANESSKTAPKLLKLQLTDGVNTYSAIEMESTPLSIETKPGTKIALKVKQLKVSNGQLLLTPKNIEILGGNVETLVSKWEVTKSLAGIKGSRTGVAGGPPPFIPFGQKIQQNIVSDQRGFKSLQPAKPKENENDDSEFKAQRQDAIAEATKAGTKKTFGGGSKMLVDSNLQKVMDKGYTEEQATLGLKYSRNNVEKALVILKRKEEHRQRANSNDYEPREYPKEKRFGKGSSAEPQSAKPSGAVSLFDFFPAKQESAAKPSSTSSYNEPFENNMSSSFRKFDKDVTNNSQHWSEQKSSHNIKSASSYNTRDYRDNGRDQPRDYRNQRDSRDSRDGRDADSRRDSKYQSNSYPPKSNSTASNQYQKPSGTVSNGAYNNNFNNSSTVSKEKYQKPDFNGKFDYNSKSDYNSKPDYKPDPQRKDYNNFGAGNNREGKYDASRSRGNNPPSKYYNDHPASNDYHKSSRNVVESMEKMNLKGNHQPYKSADTKLSASNYPPLIPATEPPPPPKAKTYPKSGYPPIVGFQNKEANEHARNALKTKNIPGAQQSQQQLPLKPPSNWQQQQSAPPHTMPVISHQTIKNQPPPPFPTVAKQSASTPMHSLPQPFVQHQAHQVMLPMPPPTVIANPAPPAVYHQNINYAAPIILQGIAPPPGMGPPVNNSQLLKIGDACLAKYWEDGQFYNAKITNISESTYVVLFTEYGNAEEVRKTDCLPLIQACPTPPHANFVPAPQMSAQYRIPTQKIPHQNYHQQTPPTSSMPYKNAPGKNQRRN